MTLPEDPRIIQAKAWLGDAVLALCARDWILKQDGKVCSIKLGNLTSNHFLTTIGNPSKVEAEIGITYEKEGVEAARALIEEKIIPKFLQQERNRNKRP
jgi:hypothetical protein